MPETTVLTADRPEPAPPGAGDGILQRRWQGTWLQRLMPLFRAHRRKVTVALAATVVGQLAAATVPLLQQIIIDDAIIADSRSILPWIMLLVLAAAVNAMATVTRRANGNSFGFSVQHDLRDAVYRHVQQLDVGHTAEAGFSTGEVISRSTADISLVQTLLSQLHVLLGSIIMVIASLTVMLVLSPILSLVMLASLPLMWFIARKLRHEVFPSVWSDQRAQARLTGIIGENITGARVVRAFGQEQRELGRLRDAARALFASKVRTSGINARYAPLMQLVPALGQLAVLGVGGWLVMQGQITVGVFLAFFSYLVQLVAPVRQLAGALTTTQQARAGAERVLELLDHTPAITEKPEAKPLRTSGGKVEFRDVTFGYSAAEPLLDRLTLDIAPGETVAVVGAAGSGKSTLALMLARFHDPSRGAVLIDGQNVAHVTLHSLRQSVATVFEDAFLFTGTIVDNIGYGRPAATRSEIMAAARIAGAHDFIAALPQGYDSPVAELGATLSGGQRQRLTLARAILNDPAVLVLDDVTSAVDARTEAMILGELRRALSGRTTLLIARRRSTLLLADRVVVLDSGRIADSGSHEDLVARSPLYRRLLDTDLDAEPPEPEHGAAAGQIDPVAWPLTHAGEEAFAALGFVETIHVGGQGRQVAQTNAMLATIKGASIRDRVAALPPLTALPEVDEHHEMTNEAPFSLPAFLRPYQLGLWMGVAFIVADALVGLAGPALVGWGLDGVVAGDNSSLWQATLGFALVLLAGWVIARSIVLQTARTAERVLFALRIRVFAHLQRQSLDRFEREESGRLMARATTDIDALSTFLQQGLLTAAVSIATCGGILVVLVLLEPHLATAVAVILPVLAFSTEWYRRSSARAYEVSRQRVASVYAGIQEGVSGARVTRALAGEQRAAARFRQDSDDYRAARDRAARIAAVYFPFLQFLAVAAKALVLVVGASLVARGQIGIGILAAFLLYLDQFFAPIQQVSQAFDQWLQTGAGLRRLRELLAERPSVPAPAEPLQPRAVTGAITVQDVTYAYPGTLKPAVSALDLVIPAGQTIAIVGETGAGKSTIARLLARFVDPDLGRISLDGIPLDRFDPVLMRSRLAYIQQEPWLFAASLADNIAYGRPDASPDEIEAVARRVGAHGFIRRQPQGYRTILAEQGRSLSAGERQLICLARALIVDPKVLILDEATAQIDLAAEAVVQRVVAAEFGGRTTVIIAHRLQTVLKADRIIVLDHGRIVEDGAPDILLRQAGHFSALHAASLVPGSVRLSAAPTEAHQTGVTPFPVH